VATRTFVLHVRVHGSLRCIVVATYCTAGVAKPQLATSDPFELSVPDFYYCQTVAGLLMCGALSDEKTLSIAYNCCWPSLAQSFSGPSPAKLITVFHCPRCDIYPTWKARYPYLYPPGTGWPSYNPSALGSLFVASYDSQGLRWRFPNPKSKLYYDRRSVGQSVLVSGYRSYI
jgi:hypothetical protein